MRLVVVLAAVMLIPNLALAADPDARCRSDKDCVFAFRNPCFCAPCGKARRRASTLKLFERYQAGWAIKVPHCEPCKKCAKPTIWVGVEAVCRKGKCQVVEGKPRPLRSLGGVQVNRRVYLLEVVFRDGAFWPKKMPRMPHHHASRFEWHGALGPAKRKPGGRYRFDFIVTKRAIHKVSGRRQWRATYHCRVVQVGPTK